MFGLLHAVSRRVLKSKMAAVAMTTTQLVRIEACIFSRIQDKYMY